MALTVCTPVSGSQKKVVTISVSNFETFVTGKVKCMNSWGKVEEEPLLRPDQIAEFYSVVLVVQEQNEDGSARMSDKALTSQQMPKLQAVSLQFAVCKYILSHFRRLPASSARARKV